MTRRRRQKPSSLLQSRPLSPSSPVEAGVSPSDNASSSAGAPGSSRIPPRIDHSRTMSESPNKRQGQNTPNLQRPVAMFSSIEQVHVSGGNFIQTITDRDDNILRHLSHFLPRSGDAAFNAAINLDGLARRHCTDGTRVNILAEIMAWINETDPAKAPPVYWLTGLAGLGKTTIAYTICEQLDEAHLPFASFFCSLQLDSKNSKLLVPTLCRDLAELYDSYAANVLSILETNSKAVTAGLRNQIDDLLVKPWRAFITQLQDIPSPIVVVDALDESDRGTEFLEELLRVIHAGQLAGIKFLVTSRPDPKIVDICKSFPPNAICKLHEVDNTNVRNDIEKYLREALPELEDEPELALLSQRAGGLFIYATTAVRFISPPYTPPSVSEMHFHLQTMLNNDALTFDAGDGERSLVDELYERILSDAFRDARVRASRLRILHTIICAEFRIDMSVLANLTNIDQGTVKRVVESLHAVLFVSPKDGCVYWYHASFPDFVFSEARAKISVCVRQNYPTHTIDLFCYPPVYHRVLARRCFCIMQESLHFNMCNLPSSYLFDSDVPGLEVSIKETFSPTLRYASRHWARHLFQAMPAKSDTDDLIHDLNDFLYNTLLFWLEAMNLIGAKFECSSLLKDVESWAERGKGWPDLLAELTDGANFSAFFAGSPASKSTPHLYISALSMWNQDSSIWKNWRGRFAFLPSISLPSASITIPLMTIRTTGVVRCFALSPDGNRLVSGSEGSSILVWDAKTGQQLRELRGHTTVVSSVAFSPDGTQLVSGSYDKSVRLWDARMGDQLKELQGHTSWVLSVAFSSNGYQIVSGSEDKSILVWDARTGGQLKELLARGRVFSVAFSLDGNRIVSGSDDRSVGLWDAKTGELLRELQGHSHRVNSVAFSPDGNRILSGCYDKSVRLWDAKTGQQLRELRGHTSAVLSIAFSPDGNRIISSSNDKSVRLWDAKTGDQLKELQGPTRWVAFSPDGNRILSGSYDEWRVWDGKVGEQSRELQGHTGYVSSVAVSPDGNRIVSGSKDNSVRVWDIKTGEQLSEVQHTSISSFVGDRILRETWQEHRCRVSSVAFSSDGNQIISGSYDKSARVWDAKTGDLLSELEGHTNRVSSVAFSPDGDRVVSGSDDRSVRVWDIKTGEQLRELRGHTEGVNSVAFSPDGILIVSCSYDKSVRVWDRKTGEQLRELLGHTEGVNSVAFSPDGNRIVSCSYDKSVRVWDIKTGEQLRDLRGHTGWVTSVAFSPDGNQIVSGSNDKSVRVWDAKTGLQLKQLQGHTGWVHSVAVSPDGHRIVSGSKDDSVRVWDNLNIDAPWVVHEDGSYLVQKGLFGCHRLSAMSSFVHTMYSSYLGMGPPQFPSRNANQGSCGTNVILLRCWF